MGIVRSLRSDLVMEWMTLVPHPFFFSIRASPLVEKKTCTSGLPASSHSLIST
jgi:hypothetical protein